MNRRTFIKRFFAAVGALFFAPAVLLEAREKPFETKGAVVRVTTRKGHIIRMDYLEDPDVWYLPSRQYGKVFRVKKDDIVWVDRRDVWTCLHKALRGARPGFPAHFW